MHKVTHAVMQHMSSDAQGVLAVADMRAFLDSAVIDGDSDERTMVAAFWQVRDPGNAGTVIRTADAVGCAGVVLVDDCVDIFNPKVIRSTAGSLFHLPVVSMGTDEYFDWCAERGLAVYAATCMVPTTAARTAYGRACRTAITCASQDGAVRQRGARADPGCVGTRRQNRVDSHLRQGGIAQSRHQCGGDAAELGYVESC